MYVFDNQFFTPSISLKFMYLLQEKELGVSLSKFDVFVGTRRQDGSFKDLKSRN